MLEIRFPSFLRKDDTNSKSVRSLNLDAGTVVKSIPCQGKGRVHYRASYWNAVSLDGQEITTGESVEIVGQEGTILIVSPALR